MRGEGYTGETFMRDVPKDITKAHDWYQKAANKLQNEKNNWQPSS